MHFSLHTQLIHSLIHSFSRSLFGAYPMQDTVLGAGDTAKNKADETRLSGSLHTGGVDRLYTDQCVSGLMNALKKHKVESGDTKWCMRDVPERPLWLDFGLYLSRDTDIYLTECIPTTWKFSLE